MADLGDAIYTILSGASAVTALVGANIYPDEAPASIGAVAYIVYKRISGIEDYTMDGSSNLCESRVQIDCNAPSYAAAKAIGAAVFAAMEGSRNISTGIGGVIVQSCFQTGKHSYVTASPMDENLRTFGRSQDYTIWHQSA